MTGIVNEGGIRGDSPDVESNLRRDDDKSASFLFRLVDADTLGLLFNGADGVVSYERNGTFSRVCNFGDVLIGIESFRGVG